MGHTILRSYWKKKLIEKLHALDMDTEENLSKVHQLKIGFKWILKCMEVPIYPDRDPQIMGGAIILDRQTVFSLLVKNADKAHGFLWLLWESSGYCAKALDAHPSEDGWGENECTRLKENIMKLLQEPENIYGVIKLFKVLPSDFHVMSDLDMLMKFQDIAKDIAELFEFFSKENLNRETVMYFMQVIDNTFSHPVSVSALIASADANVTLDEKILPILVGVPAGILLAAIFTPIGIAVPAILPVCAILNYIDDYLRSIFSQNRENMLPNTFNDKMEQAIDIGFCLWFVGLKIPFFPTFIISEQFKKKKENSSSWDYDYFDEIINKAKNVYSLNEEKKLLALNAGRIFFRPPSAENPNGHPLAEPRVLGEICKYLP